jgi:ribose/xylose/arabinose/galactoside ABC-type transport system permease subunit
MEKIPGAGAARIPWLSLLRTQGALLAFLILFVIATVSFDQFLSVMNISNILRQVSMIGLVALGMTCVVLVGGIDLSVGAIVAVAGVLAAKLSSYGIVAAITVPILVAALLGLINGFVVTKMKIIPFVATLAMMMFARGVAFISTGESSVGVDKVSAGFTHLARGYLFGVPIPAILFLSAVVIMGVASKYTGLGRYMFAVGGNEEAAKMMGLNVHRIKMAAYTISGMLAGFAGVILTARLGAGQPVAGDGWEMTAIASVVIGGTLLTGGVGKFSGTLIGVLIIGIITNMFNMQGNMNTWWQNVIMGALLLIVVIVQAQTKKSRTKV